MDCKEVILHPLVIYNISDHLTREESLIKSETHSYYRTLEDFVIIGGLLGTINKNQIYDVANSFELAFVKNPRHQGQQNEIATDAIDWAFVRSRKALYEEVLKELSIIGWYVSGYDVASINVTKFCRAAKPLISGSTPIVLSLSLNRKIRITEAMIITEENNFDASTSASQELLQQGGDVKSGASFKINVYQLSAAADSDDCICGIPYRMDSGEAEGIAVSYIISKSVPAASFSHRQILDNCHTPSSEQPKRIMSHLQNWEESANELCRHIEITAQALERCKNSDELTLNEELFAFLKKTSNLCYSVMQQRDAIKNDTSFHSAVKEQMISNNLAVALASVTRALGDSANTLNNMLERHSMQQHELRVEKEYDV